MKIELNNTADQLTYPNEIQVSQFYDDVINGLSAPNKYLQSKYFYDVNGDKLFQRIMELKDYYPTAAEMDIFSDKTDLLISAITANNEEEFDIIELGAGDAIKSQHLLKSLIKDKISFTYIPIDISKNITDFLSISLPVAIPDIKIEAINADYLSGLEIALSRSTNKKIILFLGGNIGNMEPHAAVQFCKEIQSSMAPGDKLILGIDLKKNPKRILSAYNDSTGVTKEFNLNLLTRINTELGADFDTSSFDHYASYDPISGACKSFLVSLKKQVVIIRNEVVNFEKNEVIFMEISQKYSPNEISHLAQLSGFKLTAALYDGEHDFTDVVWTVE
jgi:L-histidine N-alpha-methyltransferase